MPNLIQTKNSLLIVCEPSLAISQEWFEPDYWQAQNALAGTGQGRGAVWFVNSAKGQYVIRRYRRGGLIAKFNKQYFVYSGIRHTRPWLELSLLETMRELNLPVPKPIAGLVRCHLGCYQASLVTQTIANAQDLFDLLKHGQSATVDWYKLGTLIQRFHQHGIYHSDLNCHNIMLDADGQFWLIDFDKCDQRTYDKSWANDNIERLKRSLDKESDKHTHFHYTEQQWQTFLEGYLG
ncbi:3-deoxy-D-manno-octulosonic acid kinase [Marinomonas epiphytica]